MSVKEKNAVLRNELLKLEAERQKMLREQGWRWFEGGAWGTSFWASPQFQSYFGLTKESEVSQVNNAWEEYEEEWEEHVIVE